jgi:hypothetical protein
MQKFRQFGGIGAVLYGKDKRKLIEGFGDIPVVTCR